MLEALGQVLDFLKLMVDTVINFFQSLVQLFIYVPQAIGNVGLWVLNLPPTIQAFIMATTTITIILLILGRQT